MIDFSGLNEELMIFLTAGHNRSQQNPFFYQSCDKFMYVQPGLLDSDGGLLNPFDPKVNKTKQTNKYICLLLLSYFMVVCMYFHIFKLLKTIFSLFLAFYTSL